MGDIFKAILSAAQSYSAKTQQQIRINNIQIMGITLLNSFILFCNNVSLPARYKLDTDACAWFVELNQIVNIGVIYKVTAPLMNNNSLSSFDLKRNFPRLLQWAINQYSSYYAKAENGQYYLGNTYVLRMEQYTPGFIEIYFGVKGV